MKNIQPKATNDSRDHKMKVSDRHDATTESKLLTGSVANKYPVVLDGGRTILFISDRSKETEAIKNYEMRIGNRLMHNFKKTKA